ncbi:MAG TPA: beta-propeller domain-containing protein [Candidatus Pelethocola excrementipullorum]|nr:beta-propeller domain-containing protein [Candidatus Pelethocola excrementipullorum]
MDEKKIWQELEDSAEDIQIPESLKPERIEAILVEKKREEQRNRFRRAGRYVAMASACLVVFGSVMAIARMGMRDTSKSSPMMESQTVMDSDTSGSGKLESEVEVASNGKNPYESVADYGSVYDAIERGQQTSVKYDGDEKMMEDAGSLESGSGSKESSSASPSHSTTNVQTEGVDEGDLVKTDGSFLYVADGNEIKIIDIKDGGLTIVNTLRPEGSQKSGNGKTELYELYVDGDLLQVVCGDRAVDLSLMEDMDAYQMKENSTVHLYTYDISNPKKPVLKGVVTQEGAYKTSRKSDGYVYLFTTTQLSLPEKRKRAVQEDKVGDWLPSINGEVFQPDDILVTEEGGDKGLLISSIDVKNPGVVQDSKLLIMGDASEYVSESNIYLYENTYEDGESTRIAKFHYDSGKITVSGGASVDGTIRDTFAINEKDGYLRVLTTIYENGWSNQITVLNEEMNHCGNVDGLARGEEIYAARFLGDYGYFVTYRNTDPLFSVDFSEAEDPKIIGELKVTGFSDYLHFWSENRLLGIGYETDPNTGWQEGIKLSMFDISDPNNVKEEDKAVMTQLSDTPAVENYKSVIIDQERNLIGFPAYNSGKDSLLYLIYSYSQEHGFEQILQVNAGENRFGDRVRGVYAGNTFYLVMDQAVMAYNMDDGFKKIEALYF